MCKGEKLDVLNKGCWIESCQGEEKRQTSEKIHGYSRRTCGGFVCQRRMQGTGKGAAERRWWLAVIKSRSFLWTIFHKTVVLQWSLHIIWVKQQGPVLKWWNLRWLTLSFDFLKSWLKLVQLSELIQAHLYVMSESIIRQIKSWALTLISWTKKVECLWKMLSCRGTCWQPDSCLSVLERCIL